MRNEGRIGRTALFASGVLVALAAPPAWAQQPAEGQTGAAATTTAAQPAQPDEATRTAATEHFRRGKEAFDAGNWETALTEFRAANELLPGARALHYIGQCLRSLNRQVEALQAFRQYVELYPTAANPREEQSLAEVRNWIDELEELIGSVQVDVAVSGATVLVDGQVVGNAPLGHPVELVAGQHAFRAEAEGYRPAEATVTVAAGQQTTVTLVPASLRTTATVQLSSNVPGAVARLDGETLGELPYAGEVAAGVHQLEVSADGYETARLAITLEAGQPFHRAIDLVTAATAEEAWYEKWWVWTIAGVVVAGAVTGVVLGVTGGETMPDSTWNYQLP
jgi:tetratricopeptide (TPR) repeat protein